MYDQPVAYMFAADLYCPRCILDVIGASQDEDAETVLDRRAILANVNRDDENTFDSADFPKVIMAAHGDCEDYQPCGDICGACSEPFDGECGALPVPTEQDFTEQYREMLDDVYGDVQVAGMTFSTSRALEELDPTAFRCGMLDYADSMGIHDFA